MAKSILRFFGGAAIIIGVLTIAVGLLTAHGQGLIITLPLGAACLISGAPLLGFAQVIELLEEIAQNTRGSGRSSMLSSRAGTASPADGALTSPAGSGGAPINTGAPPRQGSHSVGKVIVRSSYRGLDYRVHDDGLVTARLADGPYTWNRLDDLKSWVDAQPQG